MDDKDQVLITFHKLVPYGDFPGPADPALGGTIPTRAHRWCAAYPAANGFGWYLYPLLPFGIRREGSDIMWTYGDLKEWRYLDLNPQTGARKHCYYPGKFREEFQRNAPEDIKQFPPTFLAHTVTGMVQIWTGFIASTPPGWHTKVGPLVNLPLVGYKVVEGIFETDWWIGPLFTNITLDSATPVFFYPNQPYAQVQVVTPKQYRNPRYSKQRWGITDEQWTTYHKVMVEPALHPETHRIGHYAAEVRRRVKRG